MEWWAGICKEASRGRRVQVCVVDSRQEGEVRGVDREVLLWVPTKRTQMHAELLVLLRGVKLSCWIDFKMLMQLPGPGSVSKTDTSG